MDQPDGEDSPTAGGRSEPDPSGEVAESLPPPPVPPSDGGTSPPSFSDLPPPPGPPSSPVTVASKPWYQRVWPWAIASVLVVGFIIRTFSDSTPSKEEALDAIDEVFREVGVPTDAIDCVKDYLDTNGYLEDLSFVDDLEALDFGSAAADLPPDAQEFLRGFVLAGQECFSASDLESVSGGFGPESYGSHTELDMLFDGCQAGSLIDCDMMFFSSPVGSEYEEEALACGGRNEPLSYAAPLCVVHHDDSSELDSVQAQCEQGFFPACDLLYQVTPVGSVEEAVALSCGDRREPDDVLSCVEELGFGSR